MKLARLLLQAFGPFTDTVLDFSVDSANLHLIYGPNEAGKSSALRTMTDLRFGIPLRSPDDFVHPSSQLRISGVFVGSDGELIGLTRRKGRGETLSRFDTKSGQPDPALPLLHEQELALTGGLERAEFEAMFGLNHARLREGGSLLLKGEGELGSALFEASAGTRGIAAILAELEADAKRQYNPHGRAQNAIINEARRQLEEQRQALRHAQTKPAEWQALHRAHEASKTILADVDQALDNLRRRENELTELRSVEPLLRDYDHLQAELEALADVPDLSGNARDERLAAQERLRSAEHQLQEAEGEMERCAEALQGLTIESALLDHCEAIERLAAGIEGAARSRIEVQKEQASIERLADDLEVTATRIASGRGFSELLAAVPSAADRAALDLHLQEANRLRERLQGYRQRDEALEVALKLHAEDAPVLPDASSRRTVILALRQAQGLGDVTRQAADFDRQTGELENQLQQALSALGIQSAEVLRGVRPLLDAEIASTRQALADIDEALRSTREEDGRLRRDLDEQRLRQRQLAAEGEVITADTLRQSRARRDETWTLLRRTYVENRSDAAASAQAVDPARPFLPDVFEAAQGEADRQADLLRADAKRAAGFGECSTRIEQMEGRQQELENELDRLVSHAANIRNDWSERLAQVGLPPLDPEALREWQGKWQDALTLFDRLAAVRGERGRALDEAAETMAALSAALVAAGHASVSGQAGAGALAPLIEQAATWENGVTEAAAKCEERARAMRAQRQEKDTIAGLAAETATHLQRHAAALQAWHVRLFLPTDSPPEAVKARLEELDALARQGAALNDARLRQFHHQAVVDDLSAQANGLAVLLNEPVLTSVDDFSDRLRKRLVSTREQHQQRNALLRDHHRADEQKRRAETAIQTQVSVLERLCMAASVDSPEELPEREDGAANKRRILQSLDMLREQLAKAATRPEQELRERLSGQDTIAMDREREHCKAEIARLEQEQVSARQNEEQARRTLVAVDDSDKAARAREAMESAAARYRAAIRPWARLRLAHALLSESLNRFRERAQAPMVAAASIYFSLMTGGRYQRLVADEEDNRPVLRAERSDGMKIGVEAMSEGTADQLYLALRLAALELRRTSHPQMPLVLDDVLMTSDDERAANVLRALARFADGGQVMLFTHHRHLIEVARMTLGTYGVAIHSLDGAEK